ncbi:MAG: hypothetical protein QNJ71_10235 [Acidimicrobiia bacterium]|nr:hypothetical protein [Acidimicrobiia bacterium]
MSSLDVRQAIEAAVVAAAAPIDVFDLSDYVTLEDVLTDVEDQAILIQYVTADETMMSIGGEGNQGWRQDGTVVLHYVVPTGFESGPVVTKGDEIREALRGRRLGGNITIESCDPFTDFGAGSTGLYGGAWKGWASNLFYSRRDCG